MENAWTYSVQDALHYYHVRPEKGLNREQVAEARRKFGPNGMYLRGLCAVANL